jgi:hypothetical protein
MADDRPKADPGWYDYDETRQAYWNGERWGQFRPKPGSQPPPSTPSSRSRIVETYRRLLPTPVSRIAFWILTPLLVLFVLGAILGESEDGGGSQPRNDTPSGASKPAPEAEPEPTAEPSNREQIEAIAEDQFGDQLRKVEVTKQQFGSERGSYFVSVSFNEPASLTGGTLKLEIGNEMREAYPAFFDADVDVSEVRIAGNVRLVDKFGDKSWGPGWITQMDADKAEKVDWEYFQDVAESPPWKVILLRPDF